MQLALALSVLQLANADIDFHNDRKTWKHVCI
jgi:hypothetical protein